MNEVGHKLVTATRSVAGGLWTLFCWLVGLAASFGVLWTWGKQVYGWLRFGVWTPEPVTSFYAPPSTGWAGIDKIIAWCLDTNLGLVLLPIALTFSIIAQLRIEAADGR